MRQTQKVALGRRVFQFEVAREKSDAVFALVVDQIGGFVHQRDQLVGARGDVFYQERAVPLVGQTGEVHRPLLEHGGVGKGRVHPIEHDHGLGVELAGKGILYHSAHLQGVDVFAGGKDVFEIGDRRSLVVVADRFAEIQGVGRVGQ